MAPSEVLGGRGNRRISLLARLLSSLLFSIYKKFKKYGLYKAFSGSLYTPPPPLLPVHLNPVFLFPVQNLILAVPFLVQCIREVLWGSQQWKFIVSRRAPLQDLSTPHTGLLAGQLLLSEATAGLFTGSSPLADPSSASLFPCQYHQLLQLLVVSSPVCSLGSPAYFFF